MLQKRAIGGVRFTSTLKSQLVEAAPAKIELLKKLKTDYKSKSLGDLQVSNVIGGMRGLKSMVWEGSQLDANEGIRFHGKTIADCQALLPKYKGKGEMLPEAMFWLLLTGNVPTSEQVSELSRLLAERGDLPEYVIRLLEGLAPNTHPMTQFVSAVAALNNESTFAKAYERGIPKTSYWEYTFDDVLTLLAKLPAVAARIYQNTYKGGGELPGNLDPKADWSLNYAALLGYGDNEGFVNLLRLYTALHGDHEGGNVSAHSTHLVGSALSDPFLAYSAGLSGLAGPLHGLAAQEVLRFVLDMKKSIPETYTREDVVNYLWSILNSGRVIPGYGHAVLRRPDPRFAALIGYADSNPEVSADPVYKLVRNISEIAPAVLTEHGKTSNPFPNVDSGSGVLFHHYGIHETNYYTVMFGVSRAIGPLTQVIWDRILGLPIERPKSVTLENLLKAVK